MPTTSPISSAELIDLLKRSFLGAGKPSPTEAQGLQEAVARLTGQAPHDLNAITPGGPTTERSDGVPVLTAAKLIEAIENGAGAGLKPSAEEADALHAWVDRITFPHRGTTLDGSDPLDSGAIITTLF